MSNSQKRKSEALTTTETEEEGPSCKRTSTSLQEKKEKKGISIKLGSTKANADSSASPAERKTTTTTKTTHVVNSVFNDDSDPETEEMPQDAKIRMRNKGKFTPTSAGPNSFNKTKHGFMDPRKRAEKLINDIASDLDDKYGYKR